MPRLAIALAMAACALAARPALAAPPPPLADYAKPPAVSHMAISPSGDKVAFFAVEQGKPRLVIRRFGGPVLLDLDAGQQRLNGIRWLGETRVAVQASAVVKSDYLKEGKAEIGQCIVVNIVSGKTLVVFKGSPDIFPTSGCSAGHTGQNGKMYGFFAGITLDAKSSVLGSNSPQSVRVDLYKVDLDSGFPERVALGTEGKDTQWLVNNTGTIIAHSEFDKKTSDWRLYAGAGDRELITGAPDPELDFGFRAGRSPNSVMVYRPTADGTAFEYVEYETKPGAVGVRPFGDKSISATLFEPTTGLTTGGVTNADEPETILFDPALQIKFDKVRRALSGETVTLVSSTATLDRMIVAAQGPGDSGTYFSVDYPTKKVEAVAWAYPTILGDAVALSKVVPYKAADGLEMQGILTLPPGRPAKGLPVVVIAHGGPGAREYLGFDPLAQAFASRGYAVFIPNYRGSFPFDRAFIEAGYGEWGRKIQTDISDGVAELARQGVVDPKRVCIVGAGFGGYAALAGVTVQHGLYRCAASSYSITDLNAYLRWKDYRYGDTSVQSKSTRLYLGVKSANDPSLKALSPVNLAAKADAPVLLAYHKDDLIVDQSLRMRDALKAAGKVVETLEAPSAPHRLSGDAEPVEWLTAPVAFVEKYNPPGADPECTACAKP